MCCHFVGAMGDTCAGCMSGLDFFYFEDVARRLPANANVVKYLQIQHEVEHGPVCHCSGSIITVLDNAFATLKTSQVCSSSLIPVFRCPFSGP